MRFAGYAAIFNRVDRGGDVIRKGAFEPLAKPVPLLWQHDRRRKIGEVEMLAEDTKGLRIIARVDEGVPVEAGTGLSFGYRVRSARRAPAVRELLALDLIEVSVVTSPMQPLARVHAVQTSDKAGQPSAAAAHGDTDQTKAQDQHRPG